MASCCAISSGVSAVREWTVCPPDDDDDWESTMAECSLGFSCPCSKVDGPHSAGSTAGAHVDTGNSGVLGLQYRLLARVFIHYIDGHFYELVFRWYFFIVE